MCMCSSHRPLCVEKAADAVLQFVEEHGVKSWAELQAHQILNIGPDLKTLFLAANHEGQQAVQEAAQGRLRVPLTGAHGDHGALPLTERPHGGAVGGQAWGTALLQTHTSQSTQEARHVDPLLDTEAEREDQ